MKDMDMPKDVCSDVRDVTGLSLPMDQEGFASFVHARRCDTALVLQAEKEPARSYQSMEHFRESFAHDMENYGGIKLPLNERVKNNGRRYHPGH